MKITKLFEEKCFGGAFAEYAHESAALGCSMRFSAFLPPQAAHGAVPFLTFLPGLTARYSNFGRLCAPFAAAAAHGLALFAADTSPRAPAPDSEYFDLGHGAGWYLNAARAPWAKHYQMETYITAEFNRLICENFPVIPESQGIFGHSMGGGGALRLGVLYPQLYKSISAFAPAVSITRSPLAARALAAYLGEDKAEWRKRDICEALRQMPAGARAAFPEILIDQGESDELRLPELHSPCFAEAAKAAGQKLRLRLQPGYSHNYYFVQTFMPDHIAHHAALLRPRG